jgi:PTS system nitrogen regulatory IIA component
MAKIRDLLLDDLVIEELAATEKAGVLAEFAALLKSRGKIGDDQELLRILLQRETLGSTGIGEGVAIPHGKMATIPQAIIAFGRSTAGVDFQSLDQRPVHLFFLLVTPADKPGDHLKTLARVSRILRNPLFRENLRTASGRGELRRLICEEDGRYPYTP